MQQTKDDQVKYWRNHINQALAKNHPDRWISRIKSSFKNNLIKNKTQNKSQVQFFAREA